MRLCRLLAFCVVLLALQFAIGNSQFAIASQGAVPGAAARFDRALELQRAGKWAEAEAEYRAVLAARPNYAEAHANLGAVLIRMDRYKEAIREYETALKLAPNLTPIRLNIGLAHYRKGEFGKAVAAFKRFLKSSPDNAQAIQLTALSLVALGRDEEALQYLEPALASAPNDPALLYALGLASLRLKKPMVTGVIEELARLPDGLALSHLLHGQASIWNSQFEKGIEELEAAAKLDPNLPRLHYSLGLGYFKLARFEEARAAMEAELKRFPQDASTLCYIASIDEVEGKLDDALRRLGQALNIDPESAKAPAIIGRILMKQGKYAVALQPLQAAAKKDPNEIKNHYNLARVYQLLGREQDADRESAEIQRLRNLQFDKDRAIMLEPPDKP
jgi:tetratricopeptide (TPR) repeat protein